MNRLLQRMNQRTFYKPVVTVHHTKGYQAQMMREQQIQIKPIISFIPRVYVPKAPVDEFAMWQEQAKESVMKMETNHSSMRFYKHGKPIMTPDGIRTEPLVIPGAPKNEFKQVEAQAAAGARKLCEYLENRTLPIKKKPIMTPDGIRTEPLVIPGAPKNEFAFLKQQEDISLKQMEFNMNTNLNKKKKKKFSVWTQHEEHFF